MSTRAGFLPALFLPFFLPACQSTECPASACSDHGDCSVVDEAPVCACAPGYDGVVCSRCAEGFHRDSTDACVADEVCIPGQCGVHGECELFEGRAQCQCALGYSGADCSACRAGYHSEGEGTCALDEDCRPSTCAGNGTCSETSGRVSCVCASGRSGAYCEQTNDTCATNNPCNDKGVCTDFGGIVRCLCDQGYGGATCADCYPGYARQADQSCALGDSCNASSCSFVGTCTLNASVAECSCPVGYSGDRCEACSVGFHRDPSFACVADESCAVSPCTTDGTCRVERGSAVCDCATGFAGETCASCAPGYHRPAPDLPCTLDTACLPETCRFHGTCEVQNGVAVCTACDAGFSGAHCETNIDDCVNSACGAGQCVDLIDANVCLCSVPSNTYGETCP